MIDKRFERLCQCCGDKRQWWKYHIVLFKIVQSKFKVPNFIYLFLLFLLF